MSENTEQPQQIDAAALASAGVSKDYLAMGQIASTIEDMLAFLRIMSKSGDYFTGYSVSEMINERIKLIGKDADEEGYDPLEDGWKGVTAADPSGSRKRTLLDRLRVFEETMNLTIETALAALPALGASTDEISGTSDTSSD